MTRVEGRQVTMTTLANVLSPFSIARSSIAPA